MVAVAGLVAIIICVALVQLPVLASSCWRNWTCSGPPATAFPGPWQSNIYAPYTRTVRPRSVFTTSDRHPTSYPRPVILRGNGTNVVFDFGVEVGGIITIIYKANGTGVLGLAFTEASTWIGEWSDASNGKFAGRDGALYANITRAGEWTYTMPDEKLRGGFRYMTAFLITNSNTHVNVTSISLEIGFQPAWSNLRAYQGYFDCSDPLLNRIWYAGAYTLQTNSVPPNTGRWVPMLADGWANNGTLGPGSSIIVDGAKRDRAVWPGDMGIAVPAAFISTGDLESVKNALQVMFDYQNPDGSLPEAGPPLSQQGSDTYHMWTMVGVYNYMLYTNDSAFVLKNWAGYLRAMEYIYSKVDSRVGGGGLLNVTGTRDWARWSTGGNNTQANILLYHTLNTGAELVPWLNTFSINTTDLTSTWRLRASALQSSILAQTFDQSHGTFRDNATSATLYPQDANSLALLFQLLDPNSSNAQSVSTQLTQNWSPIGAVAPELPGNISPFISGLEIQAHFTVGQASRALDLIRRGWGWYANHPNGTGSTVIEGYRSDGTFGYRSERGYGGDPSYVSHAHGWSAGPTSALTEYVAGLRVAEPAGRVWMFAPMFGDLRIARAGFRTVLGNYEGGWEKIEGRNGYTAFLKTPDGTRGSVRIPVPGGVGALKLRVNGEVWSQEKYRPAQEGSIGFDLEGGDYNFTVTMT